MDLVCRSRAGPEFSGAWRLELHGPVRRVSPQRRPALQALPLRRPEPRVSRRLCWAQQVLLESRLARRVSLALQREVAQVSPEAQLAREARRQPLEPRQPARAARRPRARQQPA
jgi:hypothetical protein